MARKTSVQAPKKAAAAEPELRVVRLALSPEDHREFRKLAAAEETNMALLARRIVTDWISRKRKDTSK